MSVGRVLTVGLGTPFSGVAYLVTLGYGTNASPPTPPTPTPSGPSGGGGGQFFNFDTSRRRRKKDEDRWIKEELITAFEAMGREAPKAVIQEVVSRLEEIKAIPVKARKALPKVKSVDWQKVMVDEITMAVIKQYMDDIYNEEELLLL